ncbi:hypothetical protein BGZ81_003983, partial [Podila clonocystis]
LHKAGDVDSPEVAGEASAPPPNPAVDAADGSGGLAGSTTPAPTELIVQEVSGDPQELHSVPKPSEDPAPLNGVNTTADMDGLEYTTSEQMELDDPETSEERRAAIKAESRKRLLAARTKARRAAATAAAAKAASGSKDSLAALKGGLITTRKT